MTIVLYILLLAGTYYFGQAYGDITPFVAVLMGGLIAVPVMIKEKKKGADD